MRVLVTGAAGFIGSNLIDRLLADGHEVVGVDDLSGGALANLRPAREIGGRRFSFARADAADPSFGAVLAAADPEVVFHLAACGGAQASFRAPVDDARRGVLGAVNVLETMRACGTRKLVFATTAGIYGEAARQPVSERARADPRSPHAAAKVCAEAYIGMWHKLYGLQTTTLVLGNVYGPRQNAGVVAAFIDALLACRPARVYGDGTAVRDVVYVDDVVDALARAAGHVADGRRLNIASGVGISVRALHSAIATAIGRPDEPWFDDARLGDIQTLTLDISAARHALGWEPFTGLEEGIAQTLAWERERLSRPASG